MFPDNLLFPNFDFETARKDVKDEFEESQRIDLGKVPMLVFKNGKASVKIENGKVVFCADEKEKVKVYIQMLLRTKKEKFKVYKNSDFGMTYFNYIGDNSIPIDFICNEMKREIEDQLSKLSVFEAIRDFDVVRKNGLLEVNFSVRLKNGETAEISEVV